MVCENVVRDVPGNYPVIWRVTKPRTLGHAGCVPKYLLEVRPRLIFFFFNANSGFFYVFVYSSWRPPSLFLERKPFTHEARHCDFALFCFVGLVLYFCRHLIFMGLYIGSPLFIISRVFFTLLTFCLSYFLHSFSVILFCISCSNSPFPHSRVNSSFFPFICPLK